MARDDASLLWQAPLAEEGPGDAASRPDRRAVRAEVLAGMLEREARVVPAHGVALGLYALSLFLVAQPLVLLGAIALRLASLGLTRWATARLTRQLDQDAPPRPALALLCGALGVAGASWAGLFLALDPARDPPLALALVAGCTLTGAALVIITYGPIAQAMSVFAVAFLAMIAGGTLVDPSPLPLWALPVLGALLGGAVLFSRGSAQHSLDAARLTVENRDLTQWLQVALEEADYNARHDPLTGLLNRRAFFDDYAEAPAPGCERFLLMIDLDHFKRINDRFGHEVGDIVLRALAVEMRAVAEGFPDAASACVRLGGEEFILVIEGVDERHAALAAENLRQRARRIPVEQGLDAGLQVSASIGLARQGRRESLDAVLQRSDLALYRAKDRGRDQVALAA